MKNFFVSVLMSVIMVFIGLCSAASAFSILDSGVYPSGCCSKLDWSDTLGTYVLSIPCVELGEKHYAVELKFNQSTMSFELFNYWETDGSCASTVGTPPVCNDCSCPAYAQSHPSECGATGMLNFRITWNNTNDVDIHGYYNDSEEIYYSNKVGSVTGGKLDIDANAGCDENITDRAVENIVYENTPAGEYVMKVCGYEQCSAPTSTVTAQVLIGGTVVQEKVITISNWDNSCVEVARYTVH